MSAKDSESRRFETNMRLSFSHADAGPASAPDLLFSGFSTGLELFFFFKCAHRKRVVKVFGRYL